MKSMVWIKCMVHVNFANSDEKTIKFHALSYLLEVNSTYVFAARYIEKYIPQFCSEDSYVAENKG